MKTKTKKIMLSIAGSDNSGGAGVQADIKTCQLLNAYCLNCITSVTAQNSEKVFNINKLPNFLIASQITTLWKDYPIDSIKIGLVSSVSQAKIIFTLIKNHKKTIPIVVDPIYRSSTRKIFNTKDDYIKIKD